MSETLTPASLGRITSEEITSQPECWSRAHAQAINPPARLPATGERALVLDTGRPNTVPPPTPGCASRAVEGLGVRPGRNTSM